VANIRTRLSSSYVLQDINDLIEFGQPSHHKTDVTISYNAPEDRFYVQAFIRNLEDEITLAGAGTTTAAFNDPRIAGIRIGGRF
jgi:iron complex outermembrane receptor protein